MRRVFRAGKTSETLKVTGFAAAVVVLVVLVIIGIGNVSATQQEKQLQITKDAIMKSVVQCYALESQYPPSLQYLVDNYGLTLNEDKYIYYYNAIGSNLAPNIQVFPKTAQGGTN